jgi:hypothetical protein
MWLFTKNNGHLSIGLYPFNHELLVVHAQLREDIDGFVVLLDEIGGQKHEVLTTTEGQYNFMVRAKRAVVADAVSQMVTAIDYSKHTHGVSADFGSSSNYFLWLNRTGLHIATVR